LQSGCSIADKNQVAVALKAYHGRAYLVLLIDLGWHFDRLGMPKNEPSKALGTQLNEEAIPLSVRCDLAPV
jgi:hypothetical protein